MMFPPEDSEDNKEQPEGVKSSRSPTLKVIK
jgi:hypothetical protein